MDMSLLGIIVALVVLIIICYRKFNPVVGTLICVAILAIFSGLSVLDTITDTYFTGFSDFLKNNFLLFATGTVFASLMEGSGAAAAFAKTIYSSGWTWSNLWLYACSADLRIYRCEWMGIDVYRLSDLPVRI